MARVKISLGPKGQKAVDVEIARMRDLDIAELRNHWHTVFRHRAPLHLPRQLVFRILAHRLQSDRLGGLDSECERILDGSATPEASGKRAAELNRQSVSLRPGTVLGREWRGRMQRVAVLADGFAWNGKTYPSLSKVAFAITGTNWNGPKFFGLRESPSKRAPS